MLESVPSVAARWRGASSTFEWFSLGVFSFEYLIRLWVAPEQPRFLRSPLVGRVRYALTPMALIDLLSILPSLLLRSGVDLRSLRVFRLVRLVRLLKLGRHSDAFPLLGRVLSRVRGELASIGVLAVVLIVAAASILHLAEGSAQPERFRNNS
ncbi:MAG: ion transporter [Candidatus Eisenbacteria bacterium]|nr:ion transporter [Candidatus Eisenbacteria bacterium]